MKRGASEQAQQDDTKKRRYYLNPDIKEESTVEPSSEDQSYRFLEDQSSQSSCDGSLVADFHSPFIRLTVEFYQKEPRLSPIFCFRTKPCLVGSNPKATVKLTKGDPEILRVTNLQEERMIGLEILTGSEVLVHGQPLMQGPIHKITSGTSVFISVLACRITINQLSKLETREHVRMKAAQNKLQVLPPESFEPKSEVDVETAEPTPAPKKAPTRVLGPKKSTQPAKASTAPKKPLPPAQEPKQKKQDLPPRKADPPPKAKKSNLAASNPPPAQEPKPKKVNLTPQKADPPAQEPKPKKENLTPKKADPPPPQEPKPKKQDLTPRKADLPAPKKQNLAPKPTEPAEIEVISVEEDKAPQQTPTKVPKQNLAAKAAPVVAPKPKEEETTVEEVPEDLSVEEIPKPKQTKANLTKPAPKTNLAAPPKLPKTNLAAKAPKTNLKAQVPPPQEKEPPKKPPKSNLTAKPKKQDLSKK